MSTKKILISLFSISILSATTLSSTLIWNKQKINENIDLDYVRLIVKDESFENLTKRFENTIYNLESSLLIEVLNNEEVEKEIKQALKEELIIDSESLIYKELKRQNKIDEFNNLYIDESFNKLIEEIKSENLNNELRHWVGIFNSHSWETVARHLQALSLNLLAVADIVVQVAPAILMFIKNGDSHALSEALSTFNGNFTEITKMLFIKGIENLRNWKIDTKCKSNFFIWGETL